VLDGRIVAVGTFSNDCNVEAETTCSGREFQVWAAATGKARLPTVASLTGGTTRGLVPAERRALRPGTSTVEVSGRAFQFRQKSFDSILTTEWIFFDSILFGNVINLPLVH